MGTQDISTRFLEQFRTYYKDAVLSRLEDSPLLKHYLGYHHGWNNSAGDAIQVDSGKQIRPLLTMLSCAAFHAPPERALAPASSIELIHNFSLIHDDIMDESRMRRGRESVWSIWGINQAINTGDGAYGLSFEVLASADFAGLDPWMIVHGERMLGRACVDTVSGQMSDISFESRDDVSPEEYRIMVSLKTGPLLGMALGCGALFAGQEMETVRQLDAIGRNLGIAFQMQDDVLGVWGDPELTGKANVDDITHKKKAFPILYALHHLSDDVAMKLHTLYQNPAPLTPEITQQVYTLLTENGVKKATEAEAHRHYTQVIEGIQNLYPESEYRDALLSIAELIVNRRR